MGCDIHIYREKLIDGQWVSADRWTEEKYDDDDSYWSHEEIGGGRNYAMFSVLARVRCQEPPDISFCAKGLPLRMSVEVERESQHWDSDGHTHSHLYLFELEELLALLRSSTIRITGMKDSAGLAKLRESIASGNPDWELLFPYLKWSTNINLEPFTLDVPADFLCGTQLEEIINGLREIGGDMQRVVFWFDN